MKPNLFIVGAPKCGTTAWVDYLQSHPEIYITPFKEPHYFCTDLNWRMFKTEEDYLGLFPDHLRENVIGEASVWYLHSTEAARNIRQFNPDAKIIILVREQQDYLPSLHNQLLFNRDECLFDFEEAWHLSGKRDSRNMTHLCRERRFLDYKAAGAFSHQIDRYFAEFPAEQIRVFHLRDWSRNPRETYAEILRFLGVDDDGRNDFPMINEAHHRRTRWISEFLRNPPASLVTAAQLLRRLTGLESLGIASRMKRFDTRKGSATQVSDALRHEIREYYAADNALLEKRIWRPAKAQRASDGD